MAPAPIKRVSYGQLETLWELLNENQDIAIGVNKSLRDRELHKRGWTTVANKLNAHTDGCKKDWKGWAKYWVDYKARIKKRCLTLKETLQTPGKVPTIEHELTAIEKKFLMVMGTNYDLEDKYVRFDPPEKKKRKTEEYLPTVQVTVERIDVPCSPIEHLSDEKANSNSQTYTPDWAIKQEKPDKEEEEEDSSVSSVSASASSSSDSSFDETIVTETPKRWKQRRRTVKDEGLKSALVGSWKTRAAFTSKIADSLETITRVLNNFVDRLDTPDIAN